MQNNEASWEYVEKMWREELNRPRKPTTIYMSEAGIKLWEEVMKKERERLNIKIDGK